MTKPLTLPAPAKVNLFLHILGRRDDGYHNIQTVYQFVDCCDQLHFELIKYDARVELVPTLLNVAVQDNLVMRAAKLLQKTCQVKQGAHITLSKHVPMGAGLGGGSSDAATTLLALNRLWQTGLSVDELAKLGVSLGADVPVFIRGQAAWAEGIGEILSPIILPEPWYVLLVPNCFVPTPKLYQDSRLTRNSAALTMTHYRLGQGHNDFEPLIRADYPQVAKALDWLNQFAPARMSGSGGVVFAGFDTAAEAGTIAAQVSSDLKAIVAKGMNQSPLHHALMKL